MADFKDKFTLDRRLQVQPGVTREKAKFVKGLYEKARGGSRVAEAQLAELFTSTDASFSMAHLINIDFIPQLPEELKDLDGIAAERTVKDFNPVVLRSLIGSAGVEGAGVDERGAAAIVPEGTEYPIVTVKSDEESFYSKLHKRGVRFDFTFESWINDLVGELEAMPGELLKITKNTVYAELWDALDQATDALPAVELPDGTMTLPNAAASAEAIVAATIALGQREINGNAIGDLNDFIVHVAKGKKKFLEWNIAQMGRVRAVEHPDGTDTLILAPDDSLQKLFPSITIKETDRLTGTAWKLQPKPGTTPRPVLERLKLRGYENPEIRVRLDQGAYHPGGGKVGIFEGGYNNDTSSFRYRHITGAVLWDKTWIVHSDGDGQV
ncbi:MAG: hypothetical protein K0S65_90 [Labilithrix sp.]|jgi:hypothetical protein|nr:hypothetical protein [Labilithrix sp.]